VPGFLGTVEVSACEDAKVPKSIGSLFTKAAELVGKSAQNPSKAARLLGKAAKKLRTAGKKATKAAPRKISTACSQALGSAVTQAQGRVDCLLSAL